MSHFMTSLKELVRTDHRDYSETSDYSTLLNGIKNKHSSLQTIALQIAASLSYQSIPTFIVLSSNSYYTSIFLFLTLNITCWLSLD